MPSNGFLRSVVAIFARSALFFLLLLSIQAKPLAEAQTVRQVAGVTQVRQVPRVTESWSDTIGRSAQSTVPIPWQIGHFPGFRAAKAQANTRRQSRSTAGRIEAEQQLNPASTSQGVVFDGPNEADTKIVPPDPVIAAGPANVVVVVNSLMAIYDKSGNPQGSFQNLSNFFSSLNVSGEIFDPRVIYDQTDQRFILTAAEVDFTGLTNGHVLLAVSATSDPTGAWNKWALNFMGSNPGGTASTFPDFPTLGLSSSAVYIGTNQFELTQSCLQTDTENCQFSDSWITVVGLPGLLNPSQNPALTITTFKDVLTADGQLAFSIQPALTYGSSTDEFLVAADFNANPSSTLNLYAISTSGTPTLSSANLNVPAFGLPPDAVQEGSSNLIATDDFRPLNAVWANGSLWFAQNVQNSGGNGGVAAEWYELQLSSLASASVSQSGSVNGTGQAYYPAISVEADGGGGLVFTTSSSASYPSAAFTEREASDAPGTMRGFLVYKAGEGPYDDTGFGNRWGDYSGISQDPSGNGFWTIAEYASTPNPQFATSISLTTGPPELSASPVLVSFGGVPVGSASAAQTVTVTNVSGGSLTPGAASLGGVNAADFAITDHCSAVALAPNQTCSISVVFKPTVNGSEAGSLYIPGEAGGVATVGLAGTGTVQPVLTVAPTALSFPATPLQSASAPLTITLTNSGNAAAQIGNLSITVAFTQSNTCGSMLAPGASCQFTVTFHPISAGTIQGSIEFLANTQQQVYFITLTGIGVTAPGIVLCPTAITFPNQAVNTTSSPQTVILTNNGSDQLTVTGITPGAGFSETNNCVGSLPPFASCTINVTFTPASAGSQTGSIAVSDDASGSPQTISLSGTGGTGSGLLLRDLPPSVFALVDPQLAGVTGARPQPLHSSSDSAGATSRGNRPFSGRGLSFEANEGQFDPTIQFIAHVDQCNLALLKTSAILTLQSRRPSERKMTTGTAHSVNKESAGQTFPAREPENDIFVRMQLVGANPDPSGAGADELPGKANYFIGRNRSRWRTNVPTYARVNFRQVYPGIDLAYYGNHDKLEYDFAVSPGADPKRIRMAFSGANSLRVDKKTGDLVVATHGGPLRFHKPAVYQARELSRWRGHGRETRRIYRRGRFVLVGARQVTFRLGRYDHHAPLIIDPVLVFSTYLAGSGGDVAHGIAVDSTGASYVVGTTGSRDFPITSNAYDKTCGVGTYLCYQGDGLTNAFISKLSPDGSTLIYSTYLGGISQMQGLAIAVDSSGNAYVTGTTYSSQFPTTPGAFETQCSDVTNGCQTAFVTKLNVSGSALVYSTFLGAMGPTLNGETFVQTQGNAIAVDSAGNAYVGGSTNSPSFPTTAGAYQSSASSLLSPAGMHGFVTVLNPSGSRLVYSTYLGGSSNDSVSGITLDSAGDFYVVGSASSLDFPTTPASIQPGSYGGSDAFVAKFNSGGKVAYVTDLGGPGYDYGNSIAVDSTGAAYVAGQTSGGFPVTPSVFDGTDSAGIISAFVAKLHPSGCALLYSTYLIGPNFDSSIANSVAVDAGGHAYVTGVAGVEGGPSNLPQVNGLQPQLSPGNVAFASELDAKGSSLLFSTFLGGSSGSAGNGIALDSAGNIYLTGGTNSNDFPSVNAEQPECPTCNDQGFAPGGFIAKIGPGNSPGVFLTRSELTFPPAPASSTLPPAVEAVGLMNNLTLPLAIASVTVQGSGFSLKSTPAPCSGSISPGTGCPIFVQFAPTAVGKAQGTLTITDNGPGSPRTIALNGTALPSYALSAQLASGVNPVAGTTSVSFSVSAQPTGAGGVSGNVALSCSGSVTCSFSPASVSVGSTTSTLTVSNLSAGSGDSVTFSVIGNLNGQNFSLPLTIKFADFSASASPASATVTPGQTASYSVSLSPINGLTGNINLGCTGAPTLATCAVSEASVSLDGTNPAIATVTVTTTAGSSLAPTARRAPPPHGWPGILLLVAFAVAVGFGARWRLRPAPLALGIILLFVLTWASCGGGGGSGGGGGGSPGTPAGTYSLTVTGTYAGSTNLKQSVTLTLAVQ